VHAIARNRAAEPEAPAAECWSGRGHLDQTSHPAEEAESHGEARCLNHLKIELCPSKVHEAIGVKPTLKHSCPMQIHSTQPQAVFDRKPLCASTVFHGTKEAWFAVSVNFYLNYQTGERDKGRGTFF
jgi:hypothetical protein